MAGDKIFIGNVTVEAFLIFLFAFILTLLVGNVSYVLVRRLLDDKVSKRSSKLIARATHYAVLVVGLYLGIHHVLGEDLTAFAASLGIIGIAVAFSSQQVIQNLIAGILIVVGRPFQLEDWIEIGGVPETGVCRVKDITLTTTILRKLNGGLVYMPNSVLLSSKIINYTKTGFIEIPVQLIVQYGSDIERIKGIVSEVANENAWILPNVPKEEKTIIMKLLDLPSVKRLFESDFDIKMFEPRILISDISGPKITISIRIWIRAVHKRDEIVSEFLDSLLKRLRAEKIEI